MFFSSFAIVLTLCSGSSSSHAEGLMNGDAKLEGEGPHGGGGAGKEKDAMNVSSDDESCDDDPFDDRVVTIGDMHVVKELQLSNAVRFQILKPEPYEHRFSEGWQWFLTWRSFWWVFDGTEPAQASGVQGRDPAAAGGAAHCRQEDLPRARAPQHRPTGSCTAF